jgi:hypothetical protein
MVNVKCWKCRWEGSNIDCKGEPHKSWYKRDDGRRIVYTHYSLICPKCGGYAHATGKTYVCHPCSVCGAMVSNNGREQASHQRKHVKVIMECKTSCNVCEERHHCPPSEYWDRVRERKESK